MKSPTSLIRFRNAVGVMLAMSALFAVVLSAISITEDRALGQATASATRSISPMSVDPGGTVEVTIAASGYGLAGGVTETLPTGFSYVSSSLDSVAELPNNQVRFTLQGDTSFTYTVTASSTSGTYSFMGVLRDSDRNDHTVVGDTDVTVATVGPPTDASATRRISPMSVEPGGTVMVTITASNYGQAGGVTETLPMGFSYESSSLDASQVNESGQDVRFTLQGDTSFSYTVMASSTPGNYTFEGTLRDEDRNDVMVGGASSVTVASPDVSATRSFDPASVVTGGQVVVTITASGYGQAGGVTEMLPMGFSYVSSSLDASQVNESGQDVRFTLQGDDSFTYTVTASSTPGTYTFSGMLRDEDRVDHAVEGDSDVMVMAPTPTPTPTATATATPIPTATPINEGDISRIEPRAKSVTVSAGDKVVLGVMIYGLQNVNDQSLAAGVTFEWTQDKDVAGKEKGLEGTGAEITYTAPSSPGTYQVTASLEDGECVGGCSATVTIRVRRPAAAPAPADPPQNPPGEIPAILTDGDGNNYEVFTPEDGGSFTGEGYSLTADAGAVPNGEYIGIRVSDEGSASNLGMTHQRYTLGGNMYKVSAVDASSAMISSYELSSAAMVCLPLPDELRTNISDLAIVAINADDSLTILSTSTRIGSAGADVCGNLSGIPASVAVGSEGAPAAIPTATPEPTPEAPDTGGAAPSSNAGLWALLLGVAIVSFGTLLVVARRRESARK